MIREVEKLADRHEIIVQAGHTEYSSDKMEVFDFISGIELKALYKKADYVVTHGGAGSMFQAIEFQKKAIVFPRLQKYGEHVDDHQLQLAVKLKKMGYLLVFHDGDEMISLFKTLKEDFNPIFHELQGNIPTLIDEQLVKVFDL